MIAEDLASRCAQYKSTKDGWKACCPAHEDGTPSLSITDGSKGIVLRCFAGCTPEAIVAALGLSMRDLFYDTHAPITAARIVTTYPYHDADGNVLYETVRLARPKDFRQRQPHPSQPGEWQWDLRGVTTVLYHLPQLLEGLAREAAIYLVEGEKDVEALEALGLCATTNPMGGDKWKASYTETLRGARIILLPDNDETGRKHTQRLQRELAGAVTSLQVLHLPGLAEHGDVSDWIAAGGTLAQLEALSREPPPVTGQLTLTDLADMLDRTYPVPRWLVPKLIPEGLTFLVGSPKSSKTYLAYSLALSLAYEAQRGGRWLEYYAITNPGPVVYISLEDDEADSRLRITELAPWMTTIPRDRFLFVHGFTLPRFDEGLVDVLREEVLERYHPALVVLDPISYLYAPVKKSGDQFSEVKDMLLPLRWLGKEYHCSLMGVDHRRKKSADDVDIFETLYGSQAKIAVADALLLLVRDDKEVTIHARVRKGGDQTITLGFEFAEDGSAHWLWKGGVDGLVQEGKYGNMRMNVLNVLSGIRTPMSITDLLVAMELPDSRAMRQSLAQILFRAQKSGDVQKTTRGQYVWCGGMSAEDR